MHTPTRISGTELEWMLVSTRVRDLAREWSGVSQLGAAVAPNRGKGMLAWYDPDAVRINLDSDVAFPGFSASEIGDIRDRMALSRYPVAGGMILHESMHARMTSARWDADFVSRLGGMRVFHVFESLEELRVEREGVLLHPTDAGYLRSCTKTLLMKDSEEYFGSPRFGAQLLFGRFVIGVLEESDVAGVVRALYRYGWEESHLNAVRDISLQFSALSDRGRDLDTQISLAQELDRIMPLDPPAELVEPGDMEALIDAILESLEKSQSGGFSQVFEAAQTAAEEARIAEEREDEEVVRENRKTADDVFRNQAGKRKAKPEELSMSRMPTSAERTAAVVLARELEQARYIEKSVQEYRSELPPGRLHGGEAMRRDAALWAGADASGYRPFKKRKRLETDEPTLTVGIMCDTSGSMKRIQPGVGSAVWVLAEAVYRTGDATAAQVYFGSHVDVGLHPGERLREVRQWTGGGAYEDFDNGFKALDGELNLLAGDGARLLFIISDGQFKTGQNEACDKWVKACSKKGVAVVWLQMRGQVSSFDPSVEVVDVDPDDLLSAASVIGQACVRTLASASQKKSGGW